MTAPISDCPHQDKRPVWTDHSAYGDRLEVRALREQCLSCGKLFGQSVSHTRARPDTPTADLKAAEQYLKLEQAEREAGRLAEASERQRSRDASKQEWDAWYEKYRQTDAWRERRERVLKRANYVCEGCRINRATEIHHMTYDNTGDEFLWQLVAICRDCHERFHGLGRYELQD
jgi:hypothetical protein